MLLSLLLVAWTALPPGAAAAFGTIGTGGQNREHERITRAALACAGEGGAEPNCFEPRTIDYLAGHDREFGAVGAPDNDELSNPAAHCDNADFLAGGYRASATRPPPRSWTASATCVRGSARAWTAPEASSTTRAM